MTSHSLFKFSPTSPDKGGVDRLFQEFIAENQEILEWMECCLMELEVSPSGLRHRIGELFRFVHTIKGATGFMGFSRMEKLAHVGEHLLSALRDEHVALSDAVIGGLSRLLDGLRAILDLIEVTGGEGTRASDEDSALISDLAALSCRPLELENDDLSGAEFETAESAPLPLPVSGQKTLRVDVEILDRMMNLVSELMISRNQDRLSEGRTEGIAKQVRRLDEVASELNETVMQARMQPLRDLFSRFPRMVRELARCCGCEVRLEFEGQEIALDRSLIEAIKDPLIHAVRNAVDHGIEPFNKRVSLGKPGEGCLSLRAFQRSGSVVIEISDDGAGVAIDRVRAQAVERGLVSAVQASEMSEQEILQMIFLPGFSTTAKVTTISGRGVGMDLIRSNVEKIGGTVELESKMGVGTTLRLNVPLTMAIVPALVIRSGGRSFALPKNGLVELVHVPAYEMEQAIKYAGSTKIDGLRDRSLPRMRLARLLEIERGEESCDGTLAVVETRFCRFGLIVDGLPSFEEIVMKPLSPLLRKAGVFSGATVLGDGSLALVLDPDGLADRVLIDSERQRELLERGKTAEDPLGIEEVHDREREMLPLPRVERMEGFLFENRGTFQHSRGELFRLTEDGRLLREASLYGKQVSDASEIWSVVA